MIELRGVLQFIYDQAAAGTVMAYAYLMLEDGVTVRFIAGQTQEEVDEEVAAYGGYLDTTALDGAAYGEHVAEWGCTPWVRLTDADGVVDQLELTMMLLTLGCDLDGTVVDADSGDELS